MIELAVLSYSQLEHFPTRLSVLATVVPTSSPKAPKLPWLGLDSDFRIVVVYTSEWINTFSSWDRSWASSLATKGFKSLYEALTSPHFCKYLKRIGI